MAFRSLAATVLLIQLSLFTAWSQQQSPAETKAEVLKSIRGMETLPGDSVFSNLRLLGSVPAERILGMMERFTIALGVRCQHCHNPSDWSSDEKKEKHIAREMFTFSGSINKELLPRIEGLRGKRTVVNCYTCHRGERRPALSEG